MKPKIRSLGLLLLGIVLSSGQSTCAQEPLAFSSSFTTYLSPQKSAAVLGFSESSQMLARDCYARMSQLPSRIRSNFDPVRQKQLGNECWHRLKESLTKEERRKFCQAVDTEMLRAYRAITIVRSLDPDSESLDAMKQVYQQLEHDWNQAKQAAVAETLEALPVKNRKLLANYLQSPEHDPIELALMFQSLPLGKTLDRLRGETRLAGDNERAAQLFGNDVEVHDGWLVLNAQQYSQWLQRGPDAGLLPAGNRQTFPLEPLNTSSSSEGSVRELLNSLDSSSSPLSDHQTWEMWEVRFADGRPSRHVRLLRSKLLPIQYAEILRRQFVADGPVRYFWRPDFAKYFDVSPDLQWNLQEAGKKAAQQLQQEADQLCEAFPEKLYDSMTPKLKMELSERFAIDRDAFLKSCQYHNCDFIVSDYQSRESRPELSEPWYQSFRSSIPKD